MFPIDVVNQCKANNRKAQLKLYEQYCNGMFHVALRFVGNTGDAEDVMQESFIKAFEKIHQFKGEVAFGAWLKRIVINKSIDFIKSKKEKLVALNENHVYIVEDEDWSIENDVTVEEIKSVMTLLPEKYKYVVMMYLVEGFDHGEIAQVLDLTENTCRTRLLRGKGYLRELLKNKVYVKRP